MSKSRLFGRVRCLLEIVDGQGMTEVGLDQLVQTGLLTDLCKAAAKGELGKVDRELFQKSLGIYPELLEFLGIVTLPATSGFVFKDRMVVDTSPSAKVKVADLGDNLLAWFGNLVEGPVAEQTLRYHKLRQSSVDRPIIAELGGVMKAITTFSEIFSTMEKQGQSSALLTNGSANIYYVPQAVTWVADKRFSYVHGVSGQTIEEEVKNSDYFFEINGQWCVLRAVYVRWRVGGWDVSAYSVEDPSRWDVGDQVFSRNSCS